MAGLQAASRDAAAATGPLKAQLKEVEKNIRDLEQAAKDYAGIDPGKNPIPKMLEEAKKQAADLKTQLDQTNAAVKDHEKAQGDAEKAIRRTIQSHQEQATALRQVGDLLTLTVSAPLLAAAAAGVHFASEFEADMTKVRVLAGASADEVAHMREEILKLAPAVGIGPAELARGLYPIESAGIKGAEALDLLTRSAKLSAMGFGDMETITRTLVGAMLAYKTQGLDAARASDILIATVQKGNMPVSELAGSLGRINAIAATVGVSFDQVGAAIATFTHMGVSSAEAVTGLRAILLALEAPTKKTKDTLAELGLTVDGVRKQIGDQGLAKTLIDLIDRAHGNIDVLRELIPNVRGLAEALSIAKQNGQLYLATADDIKNAHGLLDAGFKETQKTAAQVWREIKADLDVVFIALGNELLPKLKELGPSLKSLLDMVVLLIGAFAKLPTPVQTFIEIAIGIGIVGGPILSGLGRLLGVWASIERAIWGAKAAEDAFAGSVVLGKLLGLLSGGSVAAGAAAAGGAAVGAGIALGGVELITQGQADKLASNIAKALGGSKVGKDIQLPVQLRFTDSVDVKPTKAAIDGLKQSMVDLTDEDKKGEKALSDAMASYRGFDTQLGVHLKAMQLIIDAGGESTDVDNKMADALNKIVAAGQPIPAWLDAWREAQNKFNADLTFTESVSKATAKAFGNQTAQLTPLKARYGEFHSILTGVDDATGLLASRDLPQATGALVDFGGAMQDDYEHTQQIADGVFHAAKETDHWTDSLNALANMFRHVAQVSGGSMGTIFSEIAQVVVLLSEAKKVGDAFIKNHPGATNIGVATALFAANASKMERFESAVASAAAIYSGYQNIMAATDAHRTAMGNAGAGAAAGAEAGAAFGPYGMAVGAAAGFFVGLVRGKPEWSKAIDDLGFQFGKEISESTARHIAEDEDLFKPLVQKTMRDRGDDPFTVFMGHGMQGVVREASEIYNLASVIKDVGGLTEQNFEGLAKKLNTAFMEVKNGVMTTDQASKVLDENFGTFLTKGTSRLGVLNDQLRETIRLDAEFGTNSQAIRDYVGQQGSIAGSSFGTAFGINNTAQTAVDADRAALAKGGLSPEEIDKINADLKVQQAILDATGIKSQAVASAMGAAVVGAVDAEMRAGKSFSAAVADQSDAIANLQTELQKAGFDGGAAFGLMVKQSDLLKDEVAGPVLQALDALTTGMVAVGNTGQLNQEEFQGFATQVLQGRDALLAMGKDGKTVELALQDDLQKLWEEQQSYHFELDASTQAMLDQAEANGIVGETHKTVNAQMLDGINKLVTVEALLAKKMGVDLPDSILDGVNKADPHLKDLQKKLDSVHAHDIDFQVTAHWTDLGNLEVNAPPGTINPKASPQAFGGDYLVTQPTLFLAGEAGPERAWFSGAGRTDAAPAGGGGGDVHHWSVVIQASNPEEWERHLKSRGADIIVDALVHKVSRDKRGTGTKLKRGLEQIQ